MASTTPIRAARLSLADRHQPGPIPRLATADRLARGRAARARLADSRRSCRRRRDRPPRVGRWPARLVRSTTRWRSASAPAAGCRWCTWAPRRSRSTTPTAERARSTPSTPRVEPVRAAGGRNQVEAELIQGLLLEEGVPSILRRSAGFDVPDFLAAGPRTSWSRGRARRRRVRCCSGPTWLPRTACSPARSAQARGCDRRGWRGSPRSWPGCSSASAASLISG